MRLPCCRPAWGWVVVGVPLLLGGCGPKRPPADYAPDPGIVARIRTIQIHVPEYACPGQRIAAEYYAVLDDGTTVPFAKRYDADHPPALHVIFLSRYSPNALALENGDWQAAHDPLTSAMEGFRVRVSLRQKPSAFGETTVRPVYGCLQHVFRFAGPSGGAGEAGGPGPDLTVRLAEISSPFYARLLVAAVEVEQAPPFYLLADAGEVPPSDWLLLAAQGGRGGRGSPGQRGSRGADGQPGCPGTNGGAGGAGGNGGPGGSGGRGGRITIMVTDAVPYLAGLVEAATPGGEGGEGGTAGRGGEGGKGGAASDGDRRCAAGRDGAAGPAGRQGEDGRDGPPGLRAQVIQRPLADLFGPYAPAALRALVQRSDDERRGT